MKFIITSFSTVTPTSDVKVKDLTSIRLVNEESREFYRSQVKEPGHGISREQLALLLMGAIDDIQLSTVLTREERVAARPAIMKVQESYDWNLLGDESQGVEIPVDPYLVIKDDSVKEAVVTILGLESKIVTTLMEQFEEYLCRYGIDWKHSSGFYFQIEKLRGLPITIPTVMRKSFRLFLTEEH